MRHHAFILVMAILLPYSTYAQEEQENWISLGRLSLTASAFYHHAPWKKYNESMKVLQDAIRYSSSYQNPQGNLEKINGDGSIEATVAYRLISGLSVFMSSSYLAGGGSFNASFNPFGYPDPLFTRHNSQQMRLEMREYGVGFRYTHGLSSRLELSVFGSVFQALSSLHFDYTYSQSTDEQTFSANLNDARLGTACGIEFAWEAIRHFSVVSSVDYRWIKFPELTGNGSYVGRFGYDWGVSELSQPFEARLGEADGYFGLLIDSGKSGLVNDNVLHSLWTGTPAQPYWFTQQPAVLDMSGFGLSLGVRYEF